MKKLILLAFFIPTVCFANQIDPSKDPFAHLDQQMIVDPNQQRGNQAMQNAVNACMESKDVKFCLDAQRTKERVERNVINTLEYFGIKREAIIVGAATSVVTQQRIAFNAGSWDYVDLDRSVIEIERDYVNLTFEWTW